MQKITVTKEDLARTEKADASASLSPAGEYRGCSWAKLLLFPLALIPPLICVAALVLWLSLRKKSAEIRAAWVGYLCWLLIAGGVAGSVSVALLISQKPASVRAPTSTSLTSLDAISEFPSASVDKELTPPEIASKFKKLVFVVIADDQARQDSDPVRGAIGACVLLSSDTKGHFLVTSRHVVDGVNWLTQEPRRSAVLLASEMNEFATAQVVGRHTSLDLALLWLPRHNGSSSFSQPVRAFSKIQEGEAVFLIGHPEGLLFSMSSGIVSQKRPGGLLQISAPVSPGNSGGPIFDVNGRLLAIVSYKVNKETNPNAENLNFGVRADALLETEGWKLNEAASAKLREFSEQSKRPDARLKAKADSPPESGKRNQ
jgi:S1-C subfamily serine protease